MVMVMVRMVRERKMILDLGDLLLRSGADLLVPQKIAKDLGGRHSYR